MEPHPEISPESYIFIVTLWLLGTELSPPWRQSSPPATTKTCLQVMIYLMH